MLYARTSTIEGDPGNLDEAIARFRDEALPLVQGANGFRGGILLIDRQGGQAVGLTLWDSPEEREATDAAMGPVLDGASRAMAGGPPTVAMGCSRSRSRAYRRVMRDSATGAT
jgi:hypothetical protein